MSDRDLIKQEIERRISQFEAKYPKDLGGYWNDEESAAYDCAEEYKQFLLFIDSLPEEPASEDLDEEIDIFFSDWLINLDEHKDFVQIAHHFAEWQKQKDQETIELAEDHAMLAGMMKEREEMMKDAVEAKVSFGQIVLQEKPIPTSVANDGDCIKIIILKTE